MNSGVAERAKESRDAGDGLRVLALERSDRRDTAVAAAFCSSRNLWRLLLTMPIIVARSDVVIVSDITTELLLAMLVKT